MQQLVLFYNGLDVPTRQILDSRGATPSKIAADAKVAIQEMAEYSQKMTQYINDLNVPLELRRDQVDDLMPTIEEGEVVEEFKDRNDARMDKLEYKRNNVVGALMNIPIFVGTLSILADFAILEDMDAYRNEGMGDVIFGELFLREVGINAKRFNGMITIYNDNESLTYRMVRSHLRLKHHTNEQCNKILPLPKDPNMSRDAEMEEWLTSR
nr:hypothetical protein [Tanacetum cinerariifolium]